MNEVDQKQPKGPGITRLQYCWKQTNTRIQFKYVVVVVFLLVLNFHQFVLFIIIIKFDNFTIILKCGKITILK